jgi:hypothetical protein
LRSVRPRDQCDGSEDKYASAPLLCAGVESRMGRLKIRKQQSEGNHIKQKQHDESDAEDAGRLHLPHERGQDEQLGAANQDRRVGDLPFGGNPAALAEG